MEKHERYIINEAEIELLDKYVGTMSQKKAPMNYDIFPAEVLSSFCRMKDRSNDLFYRRIEAAQEVIDLIAKKVDINPDNTGFWLYAPDAEGSTPILNRIDEWFSRSGEKVQLKRKIQELEQENALLRSLIQK